MSTIDWVLLAIIGASALFGLMRGLVGVLVSLGAWLLGGWAAFRFGGELAMLLASDGEPSAGQLFAGHALCFIGVMVVVGLIGWLVRKLVQSVGLSGTDRALGLAVGVVRGMFVACALLLVLGLTSLPREREWQASPVVPVLVPGAQWMKGWLPAWVAEQVDFGSDAGTSMPAARHTGPALPAPATGG